MFVSVLELREIFDGHGDAVPHYPLESWSEAKEVQLLDVDGGGSVWLVDMDFVV